MSKKIVENNEKTAKKPGGVTGKGFTPGVSGNPGGRPKKKFLTEVYEEMLAEQLTDPKERKRFKASQWEKLNSKGVAGVMLLEKVFDRTEGKLTQPVEVSGELDIMSIIEEGRKRAQKSA